MPAAKKITPNPRYQYGKSPAPKDWHEAADAITSLHKSSSSGLMKRLGDIEKALKERKS